ncbi:uncharacterized protein LOC144808862 isoform X2 [Lissotriton helveticus]
MFQRALYAAATYSSANPRIRKTTDGGRSFSYLEAKTWNILPLPKGNHRHCPNSGRTSKPGALTEPQCLPTNLQPKRLEILTDNTAENKVLKKKRREQQKNFGVKPCCPEPSLDNRNRVTYPASWRTTKPLGSLPALRKPPKVSLVVEELLPCSPQAPTSRVQSRPNQRSRRPGEALMKIQRHPLMEQYTC